MRILHFSDFHLNGSQIDKAEGILGYMMDSLKTIMQAQKIDLVLFSGDMLDKGGEGFVDLMTGFEKFHEVVITPLMKCLELPESRFIFTPGNHDINRKADSERLEDNLEKDAQTLQGIINLTQASDVEMFTKRIDAFKEFENSYYSAFKDIAYTPSRFASVFEMEVDGISVGVASLNSVWRCGFGDDIHKIAMGLNQITEQCAPLKGKQLKIAITHYPISFLKDIEQLEVKLKSAQTFDLFFCGHSHRGFTLMQAPSKDEVFCEINSSGSLVANIYEENYSYKNAFQIIDCQPGAKYVVRNYVQQNFQEFSLDKNYGIDGENELDVPNAEQIKALYEEECKKLEIKKQEVKRCNIHPFRLIQDFINRVDSPIMKSPFVSCKGIDNCIEHLRNSTGNCRLMALSGMGKTRIVFEAFKDKEDVFYSDSSDCLNGLSNLLKDFSPKVVIIDNCNEKCMNDAMKCMDENGSHAKLVTIYNVMTPEEKATNGELLELKYTDTEEVVDQMIAAVNFPEEKLEVAQAIKDRSGNIPYMAVLLINAYKSKRKLEIDNSDAVLSMILRGGKELSDQQMDVLRAISLFEPLGKDDGVSDEYDYVRKQCRIHNVNLPQDAVDNEFVNTIHDFERRQLMEHEGSCIRIRPRPLAEWLTESWFKRYGSKMAGILEDINLQEESLKIRLLRAFDNRIKQMTPSEHTKKFIDELQEETFHDERIAFSKAGSRLFRSMGLVSPVKVAKNLYSLLSAKSTEWLRKELDGDVRRNIVWALENICHSDEAFDDAAKCLAMLAIAENEDIANNATGQFVQFFHLYLSGTKSDLKQRISLLQSLRQDKAYLPLVVKAIDNAFLTGQFCRSNTNGLLDECDDYQPKFTEICFYWRDCVEVLKGIINQNEELMGEVQKILPKHISDFVKLGTKDILFDVLDFIGERCNYDWMEVRDSLARYLDFRFQGTDESRAEFQAMLDKFAPKTFYGKLSAFVKDNHCRIGGDYSAYANQVTERIKPLAEEFLRERIFEKDDFKQILNDKELNNFWLIKALAELTKDNDFQNELLGGMLKCVLSFPKEYAGNFIPSYIRIIGKNEIVLSFLSDVENAGYYRLYASILGVLDDSSYRGLASLLTACHEGKCHDDVVNQYLRMYNYQAVDDVFNIFDLLKEGGINEKKVGYPFLMEHCYYMHVDELKKNGSFEKYKDLLLNFDFKDSTYTLDKQIVEAVGDILNESNDKELAFRFHQCIMQVLLLVDFVDNPFNDIYFTILPKYQDVVLDDLLEKLGSSDTYSAYRMSQYLNLGSGMGSGKGPLFQCDNGKLKEACFKYSNTLPERLANMCPVYEYTENGRIEGLSNFFLWLCDNFGDQKRMLDAFSANMGTYSWFGVGGISNFIAQRIPCLQPLLEHKNPTVREWAKVQLESVRNEVLREQGQEAYERMTRG